MDRIHFMPSFKKGSSMEKDFNHYSPCTLKELIVKLLQENNLAEELLSSVIVEVVCELEYISSYMDKPFTSLTNEQLQVIWRKVKLVTRDYLHREKPQEWYAVLFE